MKVQLKEQVNSKVNKNAKILESDNEYKNYIIEESVKYKNELNKNNEDKRKKIMQYREELDKQKLEDFKNKNSQPMSETKMMMNKELLKRAFKLNI